jgi:hypothetical protein
MQVKWFTNTDLSPNAGSSATHAETFCPGEDRPMAKKKAAKEKAAHDAPMASEREA